MSDDLDELADGYEAEGIEAFNRLSAAVDGLGGRLGALEAGLGSKTAQAERAASTAAAAAANAISAAEHAATLARADARAVTSWAVLGALAGVLLAGSAGYWLGHASGREGGLAEGYRGAVDEKAAASWANTPAGQLALALDKAGSLALVARCSGQGWKPTVQDGRRVCYPQTTGDGKMHGWVIP